MATVITMKLFSVTVEVILRRGFRLDQLPKDSEHFTKAFLSVVTKGSIQSMNYWVRAGRSAYTMLSVSSVYCH